MAPPAGRKPPSLALAEEALETLHDISKRKVAAGSLGHADHTGATLLWVVAGLSGTIYPTIVSEAFSMLTLLLGDSGLRELLISGGALPPPPLANAKRDPYGMGLLQMITSGLHASGWWGPPPGGAKDAGSALEGAPAAAMDFGMPAFAQVTPAGQQSGALSTSRRHLLPVSMEPNIITTLRHACHVHASSILPKTMPGALEAPPSASAPGQPGLAPGEVAAALAATPTPLLESLMLQLPVLYVQVLSADESTGLSEGQRIAYEPLVAAAAIVDKITGASGDTPSLVATLRQFFDGAFGGGRGAAAQLLSAIATPIFAAYLPSHSRFLAQTLTRLLQSGPLVWEEPLFLLVAYALQHQDAPRFVDHFHLVVQRCVEGDSEANVYCLGAAMRAAVRAGDQLTSHAISSGQPFDEIANIKFVASEERELELTRDVVPSVAQVLASLK